MGKPELEAAVERSPDDPAPYLVYADWLQAQGDPQGELITFQHAGRAREADAHLAKHRAALLGALAEDGGPANRELTLSWRWGFVEGARLQWDAFGDEGGGPAPGELRAFLALPVSRFLRRLRLGPIPGESEMSLQPLVDALRAQGGPATLAELVLGDRGDWDISSTSTGDFAPLARVFPNLERLTLHGGQLQLGAGLALPRLRALALETGSLTEENIAHLLSLQAPRLERLEVWFGDENYGASGGVGDLEPLLAGRVFPALAHLGVMNCGFVGEAVRALATAPLLPRLKSLDLSMGVLQDEDVAFMAGSGAFRHLEALNLHDNALTDASRAHLAALGTQVNFGKHHKDEEYRYVSVGE